MILAAVLAAAIGGDLVLFWGAWNAASLGFEALAILLLAGRWPLAAALPRRRRLRTY